jgi:mannobiose 2-epimerase
MNIRNKLDFLRRFAKVELEQNILPFWKKYMIDEKHGGFFGEIDFNLQVKENAPKGLILNARMLWTFSAVYQYTKSQEDLNIAHRAYNYISENFYDTVYGGYFWSVKHNGEPQDTKNQIYALAFAMYGFSEYYKITREPDALAKAIAIYNAIENHAFDSVNKGYIDAFARNWSNMDDIRLSKGDLNSKKTMNTHLHIIEAYANLFLVWKDEQLKTQLEGLIRVFLDIIISAEDYHLNLFFNETWEKESSIISYGHDIEAAWLIHESAIIHGSEKLIREVETIVPKTTDAALQGLHQLGGIQHENDRNGKHVDNHFEWWPQAEAIVGLMNTYQITKNEKYIDYAVQVGRFTQDYIVDKINGEWHYRVDVTGRPIDTYVKAGFWKCPYHNSRACLEVMKRIEKLN